MPDEISDEDRERLVQAKFSELFDSNWERRFGEEFDKRVSEMAKSRGSGSNKETTTTSNGEQPKPKQRRSSLLDKALGIG